MSQILLNFPNPEAKLQLGNEQLLEHHQTFGSMSMKSRTNLNITPIKKNNIFLNFKLVKNWRPDIL